MKAGQGTKSNAIGCSKGIRHQGGRNGICSVHPAELASVVICESLCRSPEKDDSCSQRCQTSGRVCPPRYQQDRPATDTSTAKLTYKEAIHLGAQTFLVCSLLCCICVCWQLVCTDHLLSILRVKSSSMGRSGGSIMCTCAGERSHTSGEAGATL